MPIFLSLGFFFCNKKEEILKKKEIKERNEFFLFVFRFKTKDRNKKQRKIAWVKENISFLLISRNFLITFLLFFSMP